MCAMFARQQVIRRPGYPLSQGVPRSYLLDSGCRDRAQDNAGHDGQEKLWVGESRSACKVTPTLPEWDVSSISHVEVGIWVGESESLTLGWGSG